MGTRLTNPSTTCIIRFFCSFSKKYASIRIVSQIVFAHLDENAKTVQIGKCPLQSLRRIREKKPLWLKTDIRIRVDGA